MTSFPLDIREAFGIDPTEIAAQHLQHPSGLGKPDSVQSIQTAHRLAILNAWTRRNDGAKAWSLLQGNVMDLGSGQGDQTGALAALAATVPELKDTKIFGVDPGRPDYGSPYTLEQAQSHLQNSKLLGSVLSFETEKTGPAALQERSYSTIVLSHCIWYFGSAQQLLDVFTSARKTGVKHILIAEWALEASDERALPHLLSAMIQAQAPTQDGNVQNTFSPAAIKDLASKAGWNIESETTFLPSAELHDGKWEIDMALEAADAVLASKSYVDLQESRTAHAIAASRHALVKARERYGKQARSMDVWTAVLLLA